MSTGLHFLRACGNTQGVAKAVFRKTPRHHFIEAEHAHYDFANNYLSQYAQFPSLEAFAQASLSLAQFATDQPPQALADRLKARYAYNAVESRHSGLLTAMRARDMASVEVILRTMTSEVSSAQHAAQSVSFEEYAPTVLADSRAARTHVGLLGASLCWPTLDAATNGLGGGELAFAVGRPGTGKSWVLLAIAEANHRLGKSVLFVSMEMGIAQIARRWLGMRTGINPNTIRAGMTTIHEDRRLLEQVAQLNGTAPVHLVSGDLNKDVAGIEALVEEHAPDVVCIDALYLLRSEEGPYVKKWEALTGVVRQVKRLALTANIPIISTVQFNRNQRSAAGSTKAMDLGDISGADAIPQDASIVLGIRPFATPFAHSRRYMEVLKNREGEQPTLAISFEFDPIRFEEVDEEDTPAIGEDGDPTRTTSWMV